MPTYHFAVVVDDAAMNVTHVLRGQEHLLNTCQHIALMDALDYDRPIFAHLPVILKTDGSKMGKRDRDKIVKEKARAIVQAFSGTGLGKMAHNSAFPPTGSARGSTATRPSSTPPSTTRSCPTSACGRRICRKSASTTSARRLPAGNAAQLPRTTRLEPRRGPRADDHGRAGITLLLERIGRANAKFDYKKLSAFNTEACDHADPDRLLSALKDCLSQNPDSPLNGPATTTCENC